MYNNKGSDKMATQGSSDAKLRLIICPECLEEMARDELIGTKCPLCGYTLARDELDDEYSAVDDDSELSWLLAQNLQRAILEWLMERGAAPLEAYRIASQISRLESVPDKSGKTTGFVFKGSMSSEEKSSEKLCAKCGLSFVLGGRKIVSGDLFEAETVVSYLCDECSGAGN